MEQKLDAILEFLGNIDKTLIEHTQKLKQQSQEIKKINQRLDSIESDVKNIKENMVTKEDFQVEKTATDRLAGDLYRVKSEVLLIKEEKKTS